MAYIALKPMVLFGRSIQPNQPVVLDAMKPRIIQRLIEQRRIVFVPEAQVPVAPKRRGRPPKKALQEA